MSKNWISRMPSFSPIQCAIHHKLEPEHAMICTLLPNHQKSTPIANTNNWVEKN
jgi:hypothetical protein